jgi:putative transposase
VATPGIGSVFDVAGNDPNRSPHGPWRGLDDVEIATLEWVDWYNNRRLRTACAASTPTELEATYRHNQPRLTAGAPTI